MPIGDNMTLVQKTINNTAYYTDNVNYYTFHVVSSKSDALWTFACMDLGITKRSGFTTEESARINDLAGTSTQQRTKYMLLKNGAAEQIPYLVTGNPNIHINDIILRHVPAPTAVAMIVCRHCASKTPPGAQCAVCGKPNP